MNVDDCSTATLMLGITCPIPMFSESQRGSDPADAPNRLRCRRVKHCGHCIIRRCNSNFLYILAAGPIQYAKRTRFLFGEVAKSLDRGRPTLFCQRNPTSNRSTSKLSNWSHFAMGRVRANRRLHKRSQWSHRSTGRYRSQPPASNLRVHCCIWTLRCRVPSYPKSISVWNWAPCQSTAKHSCWPM